MVEELKLAIKVDDDSIEQSLLKQFANAQKMADKVVLDFKNVNFDDKGIEAKFKALQKKAGQNPIDLSISKDSIQMLSQISDKFGDIFKIAQGKSFVDSSSTVSNVKGIVDSVEKLNSVLDKSFNTKNKTDAFKQLKDSFKNFSIGVLVDGFDKAGAEAGYIFWKSYEEAVNKNISESRLSEFGDIKNNKLQLSDGIIDDYKNILLDYKEIESEIAKNNNGILPLFDENITKKINDYVYSLYRVREAEKDIANINNIPSNQRDSYKEEELSAANGVKEYYETIANNNRDFILSQIQLQSQLQNEFKETQEQAEKTAEAEKKLAEVKKETTSTNSSSDNSQIEDLKSDIQEVKTELVDVKDRITSIESNGLENVREDVEKTKESVKELNSELTEMKSNLSSSTQAETNISSENNQRKDAFPKTSENLEQVAQSEQKVQQEAVATDKALDNISFTPNTEGFEDIIAKFGILREQAGQITKIVKTTKQTADGADISYKATLKNGSSYYLGENSTPQVLNANETVYDAKADNAKKLEREKQIWNELTTSLERYATIQKRIASNNALSTDNEEATKLLEHIHELQRNDILPTEKLTASNEKLQQINQTVTDLKAKLKESTLDSLQGSIDKYQKIYNQRSTYSSDFTPSEQYTKNLTELNTAIKNLVEYRNTLKNVSEVTAEQETELKGLVTACEKASDSFKSLSASEKGASQIAVDKLVQRINKDLDECTNYSKEAKLGLRALRDELESANPRNLKEITSEIINIENAEIRAGRAGRSFFDTLKNSGFHQIAAQMAGMVGVYDVINVVKEGINIVRELDTAMTEVKKVSDATETQYASFRDTVSSTAKEIASTNKELLNSSADFLRLGYSLEQAEDLAKNATLFVNVGDGVDITEATEDMITAMKAFDIQAEDSIKIVDDYNQIGNKYALSATDIGEAMKRSASALEVGNNSFEESIGLITAMNEIVQNSENTGNSLKVLSLRLRGAKAELEDMGEDTDGLCDSTSKLREQVKALSGVDIMEDDNTFKSTAQQVKELGEAFVKLDDVSQAALLEIIAGKSRSNAVAALLKNYQQIDNVIADLDDAEGSALRENEAIVDSIDGRIKVLSATAEEFWQKFIDTDFVKNAVSLASGLLGLLTQIIDKFGTIPTIATAVGAALSFKNVGIGTLVAYQSNHCYCFDVPTS